MTSFETLQESAKFEETFKTILKDVGSFAGKTGEESKKHVDETTDYLKSCMDYNIPHGKKLRGKMVVMVYRELVGDPTEEQIELARVLGWCAEALQAAYLVADDIMDNGETRRGQLCWYRVNNNGANALNDSFLLEHVAYQILQKYLGHLPCYTSLINLFLSVTYKTVLGQGMDMRASKTKNYSVYTKSLYEAIVTYKTGYYTVYLPVALALILAGYSETEFPKLWSKMEAATLEIGRLFQIQDDYFDCFGEEDVIGKKVGQDVEEGKCTWLFVTAQELCEGDTDKLEMLRGNYGSADPGKVAVVKGLYREWNLPKNFTEHQESVHDKILSSLAGMGNDKLEKSLKGFLKLIYKRVF